MLPAGMFISSSFIKLIPQKCLKLSNVLKIRSSTLKQGQGGCTFPESWNKALFFFAGFEHADVAHPCYFSSCNRKIPGGDFLFFLNYFFIGIFIFLKDKHHLVPVTQAATQEMVISSVDIILLQGFPRKILM